MQTITAVAWFVLTAFVALLMWAARVSPEQAESNLAGWLRRVGVQNPPEWIRKQIADRRVRLAAFAALLLLIFAGGIGTDRWLLPKPIDVSPQASIKEITTETGYVAPDQDSFISVNPSKSSHVDIFLPPYPSQGRRIEIKYATDTLNIMIAVHGNGNTIDGKAEIYIKTPREDDAFRFINGDWEIT